jgi:hypothetical protein
MKPVFAGLLVVAIAMAGATLVPRSLAADQDKAVNVVTIHVKAHTGSGVAKGVNELHAKMEKEGWRFASMVAHYENGDTEGVWVTYTRQPAVQ